MNFRVLDLSAHQGDIDFSRVKKDGIWGVMLKATEGQSYLSPAFDKNYEQGCMWVHTIICVQQMRWIL